VTAKQPTVAVGDLDTISANLVGGTVDGEVDCAQGSVPMLGWWAEAMGVGILTDARL